eukprot:2271836-Pleurochrysis_carterae.AAC.1
MSEFLATKLAGRWDVVPAIRMAGLNPAIEPPSVGPEDEAAIGFGAKTCSDVSGGRCGAGSPILSGGSGGTFGGVSMPACGSWARADWTTSVATAR